MVTTNMDYRLFAYLIVKVEWYRWRCKRSRFHLDTSMLLDEFWKMEANYLSWICDETVLPIAKVCRGRVPANREL